MIADRHYAPMVLDLNLLSGQCRACAAVLLVVAGMVVTISQDHSTLPVHAHLNLLGFVSLFLFGISYHLHPATDLGRLARIQACIWVAGTIVLTIGVALVYSGRPAIRSPQSR